MSRLRAHYSTGLMNESNLSVISDKYIGRFAPSPTGPLHLGSLLMAVASYLDARAHGGQWFVRIDDIDPPRELPGAADDILRILEGFELHWDGPVWYQSQQAESYDDKLQMLFDSGLTFYCQCSRKQLASLPTYPGHCRQQHIQLPDSAIRVLAHQGKIEFVDRFQGALQADLKTEIGDFVVRRRDGLYAYQLAAAVDDQAQGITHVVRGVDLLDSTFRQMHLQQLLGFPSPIYGHLPVIVNQQGQKLSKQTFAEAVQPSDRLSLLKKVLRLLGYEELPDLDYADLLSWAVDYWQPQRLAGSTQLTI